MDYRNALLSIRESITSKSLIYTSVELAKFASNNGICISFGKDNILYLNNAAGAPKEIYKVSILRERQALLESLVEINRYAMGDLFNGDKNTTFKAHVLTLKNILDKLEDINQITKKWLAEIDFELMVNMVWL